eukprot:m.40699 g.40699  ORF g.40699 m.40699 type:complete len:399 (+) comp18581_c0_seq1:331-1527(+)
MRGGGGTGVPIRKKSSVGGGLTQDAVLERLKDRAAMAPADQRVMFAQEVFDNDVSIGPPLEQLRGHMTPSSCTVALCNTYYSRMIHKSKKDPSMFKENEIINPTITYEAVEAMLDGGADLVLLNEIVFGEEATKEEGAKDAYSFPFFSKESFDQHGKAIDAFRKRTESKGYEFIGAPAAKSTMYHKKFGNAIVVNSKKLEVIERYNHNVLSKPTPEDPEGRSVLFLRLKHKSTKKEFVVACTHLTEKSTARQKYQLNLVLNEIQKFAKRRKGDVPIILGGDFNANQVADLPAKVADFCKTSPYLSSTAEDDPYVQLGAFGFKSAQSIATAEGEVLMTCWNAASVDYLGATNGLTTEYVSVLPPLYKGFCVSDHNFPVVIYEFDESIKQHKSHGKCALL